VAVRLTGGDDLDAATWDFMATYEVQGFPTLLIMNAKGHVIDRRVPQSVDGMLDALLRADLAEEEFAKGAAAAKTAKDVGQRRTLAQLLERRMAWGEAHAAFKALAREAPSEETKQAVRRLGHKRAVIRIMSAQVDWAIDPPEPGEDEKEAALLDAYANRLDALQKEFAEEKDGDGVAAVIAMRARIALHRERAEEAAELYEAVLADHPETLAAASALLGKAQLAHRAKDFAGCVKLCDRLVADFPNADEVPAAQNLRGHASKHVETGRDDEGS
jgi:tetratricopeptide (TPR) repeat protein